VVVRLSQFLFGGMSPAAILFLLPAAMTTGPFLFGINRILVVKTWRRVLAIAIVELFLKLFVLAPQLVDCLLPLRNRLLHLSERLTQFAHQPNQMIMTQLLAQTHRCR
jgi:hypothetical protein